jgi:DNA excision repair protein ERCC-2
MERLWLGQALHVRVQCANQARDPSYRREVPLETRFAHAGWQILIHGRADGVREEATGHFVVEEIKSVRRGHTQQFREDPLARLQAATYAWMLTRKRGVPARAELVWIEIGSDRIAREAVAFDAAELEAALGGQIDAHLARFERRRHLRAARSRAATRLRFPRERLRPGQERMIQAVTSALENGEHLLLQASTGSGKTLACLFPALQFALGRDQRIYVVTPKNLQQQTVMDALVELDPGGSPIAVRLRAKERMCANRTMICHDQYCEFARDFSTKLADGLTVRRILRDHPVLASEDLYAAAVAARLCPFELSRIAAREALVTVCDYNHVFDPVASLGEFSPRADLSEASPSLESELILRAHRAAELGGAKVHRALSALCTDLLHLVNESVGDAVPGATGQRFSIEHAIPRDRLFALRPRFDAAFLDYLEYRIDTGSLEGEDAFVTLYFTLLRFLEFLSDASEDYAELAERVAAGGRLRLLCKDPGRRLGSLLNRCHSSSEISWEWTASARRRSRFPTPFHESTGAS